MGSYAYLTINDYPIDSTKNYFEPWYFKKSDRKIIKTTLANRNKLIWAEPEPNEAEEEVEDYVYKTTAQVLKRRLELVGFSRATLEREFADAIAQRVELAEGKNDFIHHVQLLKNTSLDEWLETLKQTMLQGLTRIYWDSRPLTGDLRTDMLIFAFPYIEYDDDVMKFELCFPCTTFEGFAVAVLEVVPAEAPCLLDATSLVSGGWTDEFADILEYNQDSTHFCQVFEFALSEIESLRNALPGKATLTRLLYANTITAMETYLADTVKKNVLGRQALLRRFVEFHRPFVETKRPIAHVFDVMDEIKSKAAAELDRLSFHNIDSTVAVYERVFAMTFPKTDLANLHRAVQRRHDIVHRNGKDISGKAIEISLDDLDAVIALVRRTIKAVDKQVKDGLIDESDFED